MNPEDDIYLMGMLSGFILATLIYGFGFAIVCEWRDREMMN